MDTRLVQEVSEILEKKFGGKPSTKPLIVIALSGVLIGLVIWGFFKFCKALLPRNGPSLYLPKKSSSFYIPQRRVRR